MEVSDIDLCDPANFVDGVPYEWFAYLAARRRSTGIRTRRASPTGSGRSPARRLRRVNRDYEHFSSYRPAALFNDMDEEGLEQQRMMMLNMDPPCTPATGGWSTRVHPPDDPGPRGQGGGLGRIDHRRGLRAGTADFVDRSPPSSPPGHRRPDGCAPGGPTSGVRLVEQDDRLGGPRVPGQRGRARLSLDGALRLRRRAVREEAPRPPRGPVQRADPGRIDGDQLSQLELDLFFLLLAVAGNETTRNLISGAMVAFFDHPDQWERLRADRSLLPAAVEEMLRSSPRSCTSAARPRPT